MPVKAMSLQLSNEQRGLSSPAGFWNAHDPRLTEKVLHQGSESWAYLCDFNDLSQQFAAKKNNFGHLMTWCCVKLIFAKKRLNQDPLEALLVIFGRRALIFFCLKALGKKWKMTPLLCACAVVIWRRKNVEEGHLAPPNLTFLLIAIDTNGFRRMKEKGQIYKFCLRFFNFCLGT